MSSLRPRLSVRNSVIILYQNVIAIAPDDCRIVAHRNPLKKLAFCFHLSFLAMSHEEQPRPGKSTRATIKFSLTSFLPRLLYQHWEDESQAPNYLQ